MSYTSEAIVLLLPAVVEPQWFVVCHWLDNDEWGDEPSDLINVHFNTIWREFTGEDCAGQVREVIWTVRDILEAE